MKKLILLLWIIITSCNLSANKEKISRTGKDEIIQNDYIKKNDSNSHIQIESNKDTTNNLATEKKAKPILDLSIKFTKDQIISERTFKVDSNISIVMYKVNNENNICVLDDPICGIVLVKDKGVIINYFIEHMIYKEDFDFMFKDKNKRYYFEYYSSPVGYTVIYIVEPDGWKIWKTQYINEGEELIKNSFDFKTKTFKVKDNEKVIKKCFL